MSGCCGGRRAALRVSSAAARPATAAVAARGPTAGGEEPRAASEVRVEYRGHGAVLVRGAETRRLYAFSPARKSRSLPRGDAQALLGSALFGNGAE